MKKILILNTGGTIGMTRTEKGYMPDREYFRKALINMDSLRAPGMPVWDLAETEELLDSSNMTVRDWNEIAKILADAYDSYDGFVVLHGTDTMAYTSSALSFMLEELDKPVILTGSQIPLCELRSDGRDNLISSMLIAAEGRVKEVCIYFGGKLLRGNRAMKYSADGLLAFTSPNYPPLAEAGISIQYNTKAMLDPIKKPFRLGEPEGDRHRDLRRRQYPGRGRCAAAHHPQSVRERQHPYGMLPVSPGHRFAGDL